MVLFNFEGDVTRLSEKQLNLVTSVFKKHGFESGHVRIEPVGKAGDNFVADVKRISIENDGFFFKMVAKLVPTFEPHRIANNSVIQFKNEYFMYTKVLPKFTKIEIEAGIEENERMKYAKCYGTLMEEHHETILLEDLNEDHFCMFDKFVTFTDEVIKIVLRELAKLHSMSFILKHRDPETFSVLASEVTNMWSHFDSVDDMKTFFRLLEDEIIEFFYDDKSKDAIRGSVTLLANVMIEKVKMDSGSKYSVIMHGDCWTNNIMFRLHDSKTVDCCMIDYQFSSETNPAADILYFVFLCTDYETRSKNFSDLINYYHESLAERLKKFGLEDTDIYPREQLDADLKRMGRAVFGYAVMASSLQLRETHEIAAVQDAMNQTDQANMQELIEMMKLSNSDPCSMERCKNRFDGLVKTYFDLKFNE